MRRAAAVVIGVNRAGGLTPLKSAAAGARRVADWLRGEGFEVACLTDEDAPEGRLTADQVKAAIEQFATIPPSRDLLLVYFSGHGYWANRTDQWLLSGVSTRPNEAINLDGTMDLARFCGIPNLVFVSDACRALPANLQAAYINGQLAFPALDIKAASKIDYFKATVEGAAAYEVAIDGRAESVLTHAFLDAYIAPDADMVRPIQSDGVTLYVVPNRHLEPFLQRRIDELLERVDFTRSQPIEVNVPSADDVYIARVQAAGPGPAAPARLAPPPVVAGQVRAIHPGPATFDLTGMVFRGSAPRPPPLGADLGRDAAAALDRTLSTRGLTAEFRGPSAFELPETQAAVDARLPVAAVDHMETETGFVVRGTRVAAVVVDARLPPCALGRPVAELLTPGDGEAAPGLVRLCLDAPARSVALQADDGRCVILAALRGYIGHLLFGPEGLTHVSYVPSSNSERFADYARERADLDELRALVGVAVDQRRFRVRSARDGQALAARIRMAKGIDPTLGLYAAQAYSQAGDDDSVYGIYRLMQGDLHAGLFDVRMLASRRLVDQPPTVPVVPCCPLLTQSWALLEARDIDLPQVLKTAARQRCDSLWTTFEAGAAPALLTAIQTGELQ